MFTVQEKSCHEQQQELVVINPKTSIIIIANNKKIPKEQTHLSENHPKT